MYVPEAFREDDRKVLLAHAAANPFATVITTDGGSALVSHLPLLVGVSVDLEPAGLPDTPAGQDLLGGTRAFLRGHLARENPQIAHFSAGAEVLVIFHGPHGYVSPSVYEEPGGVPTWNYVVVHVRGRARLVDEAALRVILEESAERFDRTGWRPEVLEAGSMSARLAAIAGFEIEAAQVEGKWKISQNRPPADRMRVVSWLETGDDQSRALATLMRRAARSESDH